MHDSLMKENEILKVYCPRNNSLQSELVTFQYSFVQRDIALLRSQSEELEKEKKRLEDMIKVVYLLPFIPLTWRAKMSMS